MEEGNVEIINELLLTPSELRAKQFLMHMVKFASSKPCDISDGSNISAALPKWYDQESFKRGQKYFMANRFGMLTSNLHGLFVLLADPKGLDVLSSTGKSSTAETAKERYISTIVHMLSWYEVDLQPDSKFIFRGFLYKMNSRSWVSLNKVRKMHLNASNSAEKKQIGFITQTELALTTFGFMGFALSRPEYLGIRCDNKEDREGFVHFWAVIGHMLGVDDEFNMCLFDIETVETICMIMLRYIFIPMVQLESQNFQRMIKALLKGLSPFMPHMSYEVQIFLVRRIVGVPGYQYDVDISKEKICRPIFSKDELRNAKEVIKMMYKDKNDLLKLYDILFDEGIPIIVRAPTNGVHIKLPFNNDEIVQNGNSKSKPRWIKILDKKFQWIMRSKNSSDDDWRSYLSDSEFFVLSKWDQISVRWLNFILKLEMNSVGRYFREMGLDVVLFFIRRYYSRNIARRVGYLRD